AWLQRRVGLEPTPTLIFLEKGLRTLWMPFRAWLQRRVGLEPTPTLIFLKKDAETKNPRPSGEGRVREKSDRLSTRALYKKISLFRDGNCARSAKNMWISLWINRI
ncbi:MAG TPA: hypothetical protein PLG58_06555, partial [Flexilinea sp.]|nr:hypothetical protein [Flexilinea sp.]